MSANHLNFAPQDTEHTNHFSTSLLALDALMRSPVEGHTRAFRIRKQLAYCQHFMAGAADVFDYEVPVRYRRDARGHLTQKANTMARAMCESV